MFSSSSSINSDEIDYKKNANIHNLYAEVLRRIDELKGFNDFPDELKEELNYIIAVD